MNRTELSSLHQLTASSTTQGSRPGCYGCAQAVLSQCYVLLRALATTQRFRHMLCQQGVVELLLGSSSQHSAASTGGGTLGTGSAATRLICLLVRDSPSATARLNAALSSNVIQAVKSGDARQVANVRHEMSLLAATLLRTDSCWEQRLQCVIRLLLTSLPYCSDSASVLENVTLPCLNVLERLITPTATAQTASRSLLLQGGQIAVDVTAWLRGDKQHTYQAWKAAHPLSAVLSSTTSDKDETETKEKLTISENRRLYLQQKYASKWLQAMHKAPSTRLRLTSTAWVHSTLLCASSPAARHTSAALLKAAARASPQRHAAVLDLLIALLPRVCDVGEPADEYLDLLRHLTGTSRWRNYVALKGVLLQLCTLIHKELDKLQELERSTLSSDLTQGFALQSLSELLCELMSEESVCRRYKRELIAPLLRACLSLSSLLIQRTKLVDTAQRKLLELLDSITTGSDEQKRDFMRVCIAALRECSSSDLSSPTFIFERLCNMIHTEENVSVEFQLSLEKDPAQEDFLQGRMAGNPYSSSLPGMGPLMRHIKNKICTDCELIALLEDDNGMELLVNNKIISLDLAVEDVYKKVWLAQRGESEPMRVVYRMRGLLGDATEDMINSLDNKQEDVDEEEVYKMASVVGDCSGLEVLLTRLGEISDMRLGQQQMRVLLRLLDMCVKLKANRLRMIQPKLRAVSVMLAALNRSLQCEDDGSGKEASVSGDTISEQLLQLLEILMLEASNQPPDKFEEFSSVCGDAQQLVLLLSRLSSAFVRSHAGVQRALLRLLPFLAFGDERKMQTLLEHFLPYLDYNKYDDTHSGDDTMYLDCFCSVADKIESNENGRRLKDVLLERGIVADALAYIKQHQPQITTLLSTDLDNWKEFVSKPALTYVLKVLAGLAKSHPPTQLLISERCIPVLHKLEQISSETGIGSLAENVVEAVRDHPQVAQKIEEIRQQTRAEKKRRAMARRKKDLGALGMKADAHGQVRVQADKLKKHTLELKDESGLVCCICREGYKCQPNKVLAIYTFTKRCVLDESETRSGKNHGYSTVTHFNVVHTDCHLAAVRHARGREEWDSASLQNGQTKCNGLLPLWGPNVPDASFASALSRHNTYVCEATGVRDTTYTLTLHDLKLMLSRLAEEKSLSADSGGGGPQSNLHLTPYLSHMALYVMNTSRCLTREETALHDFMNLPPDRWFNNSFEADGAWFFSVLAVHVLAPAKWLESRLQLLGRLLVTAHVRKACTSSAGRLEEVKLQSFAVYKPALVFFGLLDKLVNMVYKPLRSASSPATSRPAGAAAVVTGGGAGTGGAGGTSKRAGRPWAEELAELIRQHDPALLASTDRLAQHYTHELITAQSLGEMFDVLGLLGDVEEPDKFIEQLLRSMKN